MKKNPPLNFKVRYWDSDDYEVSFEFDLETYNHWLDMVRIFSKMKYGRIYLTTED